MGLLDGRVAVITGAGGGLGRAYALLFAAEGARVVVNDLGGDRHGSGTDSSAADRVVDEIRAAGGEAVADHHSVVGEGAEIIATALHEYRTLDILVNNAGILRDKSLVKMTEAMWDAVIAVHLRGTFECTQAAAKVMRELRYGRVLNTSSLSGLIGNFGQSNYGAAKAGVAGFTRVVAKELASRGITVNAIAPMAKTRMTEELDMVPSSIRPEHIAPVALWLCSDLASEVTGRVFGAHGAQVFEYRMVPTRGVTTEGTWTARELASRLSEIEALDGLEVPEEPIETTRRPSEAARAIFEKMPAAFVPERAEGFSAVIHFAIGSDVVHTLTIGDGVCSGAEGAVGEPDCTLTYDSEQVFLDTSSGKLDRQKAFIEGLVRADDLQILMRFAQVLDPRRARGERIRAGVNRDCIGRRVEADHRFTREEMIAYAEATSDPNPGIRSGERAPPLVSVLPLIRLAGMIVLDPELGADVLRLVHGEQDLRFHAPVPSGVPLKVDGVLAQVETKDSGELLRIEQTLVGPEGLLVSAVTSFFIRAATRSGAKRTRPPERVDAPAFSRTVDVAADQSLRYAAASGDQNPIHTDDATARAAGHPGMILHGLCTMAFAGQAVVEEHLGGDVSRLRRLKVRFDAPVLPGQRLTTRGWSGDGGVEFTVTNEGGQSVITKGIAEVEP
ncbi:MAG TPA: SDR family NAD(P)-dependent oxidoreductase [Myxococcota bacterium]|nr:SDR family NAD(P)-dependent oxidoreductase [Myxococcota bacterium]